MADHSLSLGVIFTGGIDKALKQAMAELRGFASGKGFPNVEKSIKGAADASGRMKRNTEAIGKQIGRVEKGFDRIAAAFKVVVAYGLAGSAIYRLITAFREGTKAIIDYDQSLKNLQAILSATDAQVELLGQEMLNVAATTRYSVEEVAQAMILLGQSGLSAAESLDTIQAVADLATGTLSDMKTTSDLLTTAIRAFGIDSSRSAEIADVFASAVNKSKLTIDKLRIAFNYVAPVAAKAGLSYQEVTAAMMVLANAGIRASTIGTGLRQVFARLVAPNAKLREQYIALGIDLDKLNPKTNDLAQIIERLTLIVPDASRAFELFGLRGAPAIAALTKAGADGFLKMYRELQRVGIAAQMAQKQMEGLGVQLKQLGDKLGVLAIAIGDTGFASALNESLQVLRSFVDFLTDVVRNPIVKFILSLTQILAVLGTLKLVVAGVTYGLKQMGMALIAFSTAQTIAEVRTLVTEIGLFNAAMVALTNNTTKVTLATTRWGKVMAGLSAFLAAHPLFSYAMAFTTVILAAWQFIKASAEVTKELEKQWIAADKIQRKLEGYAKTLKEQQGNILEFNSTLQRMRTEFEELGPAIDDAAGDVDKITKAIQNLVEEQEKFKTKAVLDQLDLMIRKVQEVSTVSAKELFRKGLWGGRGKGTIFTPGQISSPEELMGDPEGYKRAVVSLTKIREELVKVQHRFKEAGLTIHSTDVEMEAWLRTNGMVATNLKDVILVMRQLIDAQHQLEVNLDTLSKRFRAIPGFFENLMKQLDPREMGEFLKAYAAAQSDIERQTKRLQELMDDMAEAGSELWKDRLTQLKTQAATETAALSNAITRFAELKGKDVESDRTIYLAKIKLLKMWIKQQNDTFDDQIAYLKKNIEERRKLIEQRYAGAPEMKHLKAEELKALTDQEKKSIAELLQIKEARVGAILSVVRAITQSGNAELIKQEENFYARLLRLQEQFEMDSYKKLDIWYERKAREIVLYTEKAMEQARGNWKKQQKIQNDGIQASFDLDASWLAKKLALDYDYFKKKLNIQVEADERLVLEQIMAGEKGVDKTRDITEKRLRIQIGALEKEVSETKKAYDAVKDLDDKYRDIKLDAENRYTEALLALVSARYRLWVMESEDAYKKIDVFSEAWYEREKKRLESVGASWRELLLLQAEYLERGTPEGEISVGSLEDWDRAFKGLEAGWNRVVANMRTQAQIVADGIVTIYDQMQSSISDILYDGFKTGFDNIREMWQNLADAMLRIFTDMLAEMIVKYTVLGFAKLFGFALGGGGGGWGGLATSGPGAAWVGPTGHEGGVVPQELTPQTFTAGLARDEVVAVLKKNEVIFTPKQMKALGQLITAGRGTRKPIIPTPQQLKVIKKIKKHSTSHFDSVSIASSDIQALRELVTDKARESKSMSDSVQSFREIITSYLPRHIEVMGKVIERSRDREAAFSREELRSIREIVEGGYDYRQRDILKELVDRGVEESLIGESQLNVLKEVHSAKDLATQQSHSSVVDTLREISSSDRIRDTIGESRAEIMREFAERIDRDLLRVLDSRQISVLKDSVKSSELSRVLDKESSSVLREVAKRAESQGVLESEQVSRLGKILKDSRVEKIVGFESTKILKDIADRTQLTDIRTLLSSGVDQVEKEVSSEKAERVSNILRSYFESDKVMAVVKKDKTTLDSTSMETLSELIPAPVIREGRPAKRGMASARLFTPKQTALLGQLVADAPSSERYEKITSKLKSRIRSVIFTSSQLDTLKAMIKEVYKENGFESTSDQLRVIKSLIKDRDSVRVSREQRERLDRVLSSDRDTVVMSKDRAELLRYMERSIARDSTTVLDGRQLEILRDIVSRERDREVSRESVEKMTRISGFEKRVSDRDVSTLKETAKSFESKSLLSRDNRQKLVEIAESSIREKHLSREQVKFLRDTLSREDVQRRLDKSELDRLREVVSVKESDSRFGSREVETLREMIERRELEQVLPDWEIKAISDTIKSYDSQKILTTDQLHLLKRTVERNDLQRLMDSDKMEVLRELSHVHLDREHEIRSEQIQVLKELFASRESRDVIRGQDRSYISKIIRDSSVQKIQFPKEASVLREVLESKSSEAILGSDKVAVLRDMIEKREVSTDKHLEVLRDVVSSRDIRERIVKDAAKISHIKELLTRVEAFHPVAKFNEVEALRMVSESALSEKILSANKLRVLREIVSKEDSERVLKDRQVEVLREMIESKDVGKVFSRDHQAVIRELVDEKYLLEGRQTTALKEMADRFVKESQLIERILQTQQDSIETAFSARETEILKELARIENTTIESIIKAPAPSVPGPIESFMAKAKGVVRSVVEPGLLPVAAPSFATGPVGEPVASTAPPAGGVVAHGGGTIGRDIMRTFEMSSVIDRGMKADEVLAILKRNETVFTPNQMKKLGEMMGRSGVGDTTSINVPVSVSGAGKSRRLANELRYEIEDVVRRTLKKQLM